VNRNILKGFEKHDLDFSEKVVALYQYTAQNEDELSFEKDDVITLLAKEEEAWWRGELNGVSGLFPSNYVAPVCKYILVE